MLKTLSVLGEENIINEIGSEFLIPQSGQKNEMN